MFRERLGVAEWRATLLFLFAAQIANRDAEWGIRLLGRMLQDQDRTGVKANPAPAVFIAEALDLCLTKKYGRAGGSEGATSAGSPSTPSRTRLCCPTRGTEELTLGRLDDPRIRDLRDPRAYVEVPAGIYPTVTRGRRSNRAWAVRSDGPSRRGGCNIDGKQIAPVVLTSIVVTWRRSKEGS